VTSAGDCRNEQRTPEQHVEARTPAALQEERAVKANLPDSTSSLSSSSRPSPTASDWVAGIADALRRLLSGDAGFVIEM